MPDEKTKEGELLSQVEEKIFTSINQNFNLSELAILDDVNASRSSIEKLGVKIAVGNPEIAASIFEIAHSIYYAHSAPTHADDFFEAVIRLGADRIKLLLFSLSLFSMGKGPDARVRAAKSASIGILGRIIGEQMNLKDELIRKIETGGLLSQLGRSSFMKARELGMDIPDEVVDKYSKDMAVRIIRKLELDPFLEQAADLSVVEYDENSFSILGVIKLAEAVTEDSFRRYGKLVIKSPMPDRENVVAHTPGSAIKRLFAALGVEDYLEVREIETQRQKEATQKKQGRNEGKKFSSPVRKGRA